MTGPTDPQKPGWKTSEFWLILVSVVMIAVANSGAVGGEESSTVKLLLAVGGAIGSLAGGAYAIARGMVKSAQIKR